MSEEKEVLVGELICTMYQLPDGEQIVRARGPLKNRMLCYAILEGAKDVVRSFSEPKPAIKRASLAEVHSMATRKPS